MPLPLPPDGFRAQVEATMPHRLLPGSFVDLKCRIQNLGVATLDSEPPNPVHLSYRWFEGATVLDWEAARTALPAPLGPGEEVAVNLPVSAPETPGNYRLCVALVQEHTAWFDDLDAESGAQAAVAVRPPRRLRLRARHALVERFPPPELPWTGDYARRHGALVSAALDEPVLLSTFEKGCQLPKGYGYGFDERVVEFPWLFSHRWGGRILDAGSTLNHRHVLERLGERARALTIVTLAPEPSAFPELGVTYLYEDLRALPLPNGHFDTVVCLSTLEHIGMDNSRFGAPAGRSLDPDADRKRAIAELRRVTAPGGTLFLTVPYGRPEDHGWILQFGREDVEGLRALLEPAEWGVDVYEYTSSGWQRSDLERAKEARFEDHGPGAHATQDRAAAARAVACIRAALPSRVGGSEVPLETGKHTA